MAYRPQPYKLKSWTDTVAGYLNEADKLARCIQRNRRYMTRDYSWAVAINVEKPLSVESVKVLWQRATRKLAAAGIVALWVREPSWKNHVNYHLIVASRQSSEEVSAAIEQAMPSRSAIRWHKQVRPIASQWSYSRYIVKAKMTGALDDAKMEDKFSPKRLLFRPNLSLRKVGTIGKFWRKPKKTLWDEIRATEQRISDGSAKPNVERLVQHVHLMLNEDVSVTRIRRSFFYWADADVTRLWIKDLFGDNLLAECAEPKSLEIKTF